ncbi:MAG: His-Xaa-Ser system radical SAM maturase HxsB [Candidatus Iainarchaeum archaeon]|uniref:His-Xaa-Ser system radical SAM maturase HxsB n=1 Tax=Candidatus Iainarchaeum sp. TaxID=3101447 RepID=A0A497JFL7_9ARCH|nr:MAG: His-Xaa-Ser system radical SAM maturase HxsB [Candidatus Diapherotrites archaeon]
MVKSYYDATFSEEDYILNNFNVHKFDDDNYLVTTEHGAWALLNKQEYDLLRLHKLSEDPNLLNELKEKGIIITEDNTADVVKAYRERYHFLFQGPSLHIIVPTLRCNQRCIYCHSRAEPESGKGYDMDRDTAKAVVDFIFKTPSPVIIIEFQGGDCLLNYEITEFIIDYAKEKAKQCKKNVGFSLVTNLTKMDESIIKSLKERHIMGLATSLDGPKEVHDKNRKYISGRGTYDDVVYWIKRIKEEWKFDFNLNALCTITRYSLDYGKEIVDEYMRWQFNGVWLRFLNNIGFAADSWNKIGYSASEYLDFYKRTLDYIVHKNNGEKPFSELMTVIFLRKILSKRDPMFTDIQSPCGAAIGQLLYNYNGDIHTCDEGKLFEEFKLGNVFSSKYEDIYKNENLIAMMDISSKKNYLCDNCPWNPYCGICPIYTYAAQGTIVSKLALNDRCKIMKGLVCHIFEKLLFSKQHRETFFNWLKHDKVFS